MLKENGISAECITGETSKKERDQIISDFKAGKIRALTNANVLTTGFDYPDIDLIAMLRATMSPALYVQMAGRGLRPKSHTDHCLVLDFAGVVETHGPITNVTPPKKKGSGTGEAPVKVCESCGEIVHISAKVCPACGAAFPVPEEKTYRLYEGDIMGDAPSAMIVTDWRWRKHTSRASGKEMIAVDYYGGISDPIVTEYFTILHGGYAGSAAIQRLATIAIGSGCSHAIRNNGLNQICSDMQTGRKPHTIHYKKEGKHFSIVTRREF
jgi:DNA repair protein RadD